jgi:hypothetical protein
MAGLFVDGYGTLILVANKENEFSYRFVYTRFNVI